MAPDTERSKGGKVGSVVDGSLPDVEPTRSDVADADNDDVDEAPREQAAPRRRRRSPVSAMFRVLKRLWIPLVALAVIGAGGWTVSQLHGIFGSENSLSYADTRNDEAKPLNPKNLRYEIFGPPGTSADISYFNANGDPEYVEGVALPWSLEFPITAATGVGSVAAQSDGDSISCRLLVDNVVKAEKTKDAVSAFTSCMLKAA
jgi:nitrate reductase NapE component